MEARMMWRTGEASRTGVSGGGADRTGTRGRGS